MWEFWKNQFLTCIDKHAPIRSKRIGNKKSPWITHELIRKMRKRDFLKKKAERTKDQYCWIDFKAARNEVNNSIKYAKLKYFCDSLSACKKDPRKTWQLVNELSSRQHMKKVIADFEIGDIKISSASEMADLTATSLTLVTTWQETYLVLILILFQKAILSQLMRLSVLKVVAQMKSENYLKN